MKWLKKWAEWFATIRAGYDGGKKYRWRTAYHDLNALYREMDEHMGCFYLRKYWEYILAGALKEQVKAERDRIGDLAHMQEIKELLELEKEANA